MQFSDLLIIQPRRIPIIWGKKSDKIIIFSRWNYRIIQFITKNIFLNYFYTVLKILGDQLYLFSITYTL